MSELIDNPFFDRKTIENCIKGDDYFKSKQCSVKGSDGENCPDMPIIQMGDIFLCKRCNDNVLAGAYE